MISSSHGSTRAASPTAPPHARSARRRGLAAAVAAYVAWGFFPVYFKSVGVARPLEILAHRIVWSMAFLVLLVAQQRRGRALARAFTQGKPWIYAISTALISANWLIFIWAVNTGRVLESSLGYFMNPLVNVLLGVAFFHEHLSRRQGFAVALACLGGLALTFRLGVFPWVSLALAATFGLYGFVRKRADIDAVIGLLVETALLAPWAAVYLIWLGWRGQGTFGSSALLTTLLSASGVVTAVPLIWFALGMRALKLSTMGLIQYATPSCQFLLAVALYHEQFTTAHAVAFGCIWGALALYTWEALPMHSGAPTLQDAPR